MNDISKGEIENIRSFYSKIRKKADAKLDENPYYKARLQILEKCPAWKRSELLRMESEGDKDNRHYMAFVEEVCQLGDSFSV